MSATTYYAGRAEEQLADAQRVLDRHATSSADGTCLTCGTPGPCCRRETAVKIFSRYCRMPRRTPGATKPERVGAPATSVAWFGAQATGWAAS